MFAITILAFKLLKKVNTHTSKIKNRVVPLTLIVEWVTSCQVLSGEVYGAIGAFQLQQLGLTKDKLVNTNIMCLYENLSKYYACSNVI